MLAIAVFCDYPGPFVAAMRQFRQVEPGRPVVCVFEDIDTLIRENNDLEILQWLDGAHQIGQVVNLATTNHPGSPR